MSVRLSGSDRHADRVQCPLMTPDIGLISETSCFTLAAQSQSARLL